MANIEYPAAGLALAALLGLAGPGSARQEAARPRVEDARTALEQWVETRRVLSREQREWALGREMLDERIELVRREIESLRGRLDEARASIAEADGKRAELVEENELLKQGSSALAGTAGALEARTRELLRRLPEPIRERVKPLSQRLPGEGDETEASLGERFQNVVGILNEVNKFQRDITVTSEVRELGDGTTAEVTAVYVGLGHAWYVSANGTAAGVGRPSDEGWTWSAANESAPEIARALAILGNEQVAGFVGLPVRLGQVPGASGQEPLGSEQREEDDR